jgi:hypothetical protein
MTRIRPAIWVLMLSAIALATAAVVIAMAGSGSSVASVGARPAASQSVPTDSASGGASASDSIDSDQASAGFDTRTDATVLPVQDVTMTPVSIAIRSLGVTAEVGNVGIDGLGRVDVPRDVFRTGWYQYSVRPGSPQGSTVIVGHKDGVDQGAGAFFALGEAAIDDIVVVTTANGTKLRYQVVARESFDKNTVPLNELFAATGPHRLTLITCGGPFDATTLGYTDNVVVTAVPVDSASGAS